jgi:hypothetical protein
VIGFTREPDGLHQRSLPLLLLLEGRGADAATVALADHEGLKPRQLAHIEREIKERRHEIVAAWAKHFG